MVLSIVMPKVPKSETNAKHKPDSELAKEDGFGGIVIAWYFWLLKRNRCGSYRLSYRYGGE